MIVGEVVLKYRTPRDQVLAFGSEGILQTLVKVVNVRLRVESRERPKIRAAIGIVKEVVELEAVALNNHFPRRPRLIGAIRIEQVEIRIVRIDGRAHHRLSIRHPVLVQLEAAIDAAHAIEKSANLPIGVKQAD